MNLKGTNIQASSFQEYEAQGSYIKSVDYKLGLELYIKNIF